MAVDKTKEKEPTTPVGAESSNAEYAKLTQQSQGVPLIYPAMAEILSKCGAITKDRKNPQQGYSFRGVDDLYNELHQYFAEAGVFIMPEILDYTREERLSAKGTAMFYVTVKVKYTFFAKDGSFVTASGIGEAISADDKGSNKSQSSAIKYTLFQALLIPTQEKKDVEDDVVPDITPNPQKQAATPPKQETLPPMPDANFNTFLEGYNAKKYTLESATAKYSLSLDQLRQVNEAKEIMAKFDKEIAKNLKNIDTNGVG